jgi:hypothetical protein
LGVRLTVQSPRRTILTAPLIELNHCALCLTDRRLLLMTTSSYRLGTNNGKADLLDHPANTSPTKASLLMISK